MTQNQIDFTDAEIADMLAARRARMINHWAGMEAAIRASNLSELEVTLGRLSEAVADGRRAIEFADRMPDPY